MFAQNVSMRFKPNSVAGFVGKSMPLFGHGSCFSWQFSRARLSPGGSQAITQTLENETIPLVRKQKGFEDEIEPNPQEVNALAKVGNS